MVSLGPHSLRLLASLIVIRSYEAIQTRASVLLMTEPLAKLKQNERAVAYHICPTFEIYLKTTWMELDGEITGDSRQMTLACDEKLE